MIGIWRVAVRFEVRAAEGAEECRAHDGVGAFLQASSRTRGSGADGGVRPTNAARRDHIGMATETLSLSIRGMSCGNCARGVERTLSATQGVSKATVDLAAARATVEYEPGKVTPEALAAAVRKLGYEVAG